MTKLIWASVKNTDNKSNFISYELLTVCRYRDGYGETYIDSIVCSSDYWNNSENAVDDVFYQVLGHYRLDQGRSPILIGTYYNPKTAIRVIQDITGSEVDVRSF